MASLLDPAQQQYPMTTMEAAGGRPRHGMGTGLLQPPPSFTPFEYQRQDPKKMAWAGLLMDMGNYIGSGGRSPMQGLAMQNYFNAEQNNRYGDYMAHQQAMQNWQAQNAYQTALRQQQTAQAKAQNLAALQSQYPGYNPEAPAEVNAAAMAGVPYAQWANRDNMTKLVIEQMKIDAANARAAQTAAQQAETAAAEMKKQQFSDANTLRDDVNSAIKPYVELRDTAASILNLAKVYQQPEPADDAAKRQWTANKATTDASLLYRYIKMLDPQGALQEGDKATVRNTTGIAQQYLDMYNQATTGQGMSDAQRRGVLSQIIGIAETADQSLQSYLSTYRDMTGRYGLNPADVLPNLPTPDYTDMRTWIEQPGAAGSGAAGSGAAGSGAAGSVKPGSTKFTINTGGLSPSARQLMQGQ